MKFFMIKSILCSFLLLAVVYTKAQDAQLSGAKSVIILSSLIGKSVADVKVILLKYNLENKEVQKNDEDLKVDIYPFYRKGISENQKREEPQYYLGCKNNKVLFVTVSFEPEEDEDGQKIISSLKTQFTKTSFNLEKDKSKSMIKNEGGFKFLKEVYWHKNNQTSLTSFLLNDDNSIILLVLGEMKYVNSIFELNKSDFGIE